MMRKLSPEEVKRGILLLHEEGYSVDEICVLWGAVIRSMLEMAYLEHRAFILKTIQESK